MTSEIDKETCLIAGTYPGWGDHRKGEDTHLTISNAGLVRLSLRDRKEIKSGYKLQTEKEIPLKKVKNLMKKAKGMVDLSKTFPCVDDVSGRSISIYENEELIVMSFPSEGTRKHPARKQFDVLWNELHEIMKTSEPVGGHNSGGCAPSA